MGAGTHLFRTLTVAVTGLLASGCIDFVAPDLPEVGAPAVFQGVLRVRDSGSVQVNGQLAPGIDEDGFRRRVPREDLLALGRDVPPQATVPNGTRSYFAEWVTTVDSVAGTLSFEAPAVEDVGAPPSIRWSGIARLDPDTLLLEPGSDLVVRVRISAADVPPPLNSSWLLQLTGSEGQFRIGADGAPPDSIAVPARWLPEAEGGTIAARLGYTRTTSIRPPGTSYVALFLVDAGIEWTIRVSADEHAAGDGNAGNTVR